ncbi:MAG: hypothetical protein DWQ36_03935 [Acidobacteria bacterium]|nr:MAG: hypothetical protein DWQ30_25190 [Acidobacteriota bacterium]REK10572.1 MAG: hypothetical protein DWQ36_03935 [Acidobacteriota bacterium]
MEIKNKTRKPLVVPLPGGKKLHLGPLATGQISPHAKDHPPLVKLVDAGQVEIGQGHDAHAAEGRAKGGEIEGPQVRAPQKNLRRSGER